MTRLPEKSIKERLQEIWRHLQDRNYGLVESSLSTLINNYSRYSNREFQELLANSKLEGQN